MDGFDIRNPWNSWGCAPLWYIVLWNYVKIAQSLTISKKGMDKSYSWGYNRPTSCRVRLVSDYFISLLDSC